MNPTLRTVLRLLGALAVLAGGLLHLKIWNHDYRPIPSGALPGLWVVKTGFPAQAALSIVVALLIVVIRRPLLWVIGLLVDAGSIVALVLSRQASLFGWKEPNWSSNAKQVMVVELVAVVLLGALLVLDLRAAGNGADGDAR